MNLAKATHIKNGSSSSLIGLDFSSQNLDSEGARLLASSLDQVPFLAYLNIQDNNIGPEGITI